MKWQWSVASLLVFLLSSNSFAVLAFDEGDGKKIFLWREGKKVHYRLCRVGEVNQDSLLQFKESILPNCEKDPKKGTFEAQETTYYKSAAALHKIPTSKMAGESPDTILASIAAASEMARRSNQQFSSQDLFEKFLTVYHDVLEALEPEGSRYMKKSDSNFDSIHFVAISALSDVYSDGETNLLATPGGTTAKIFETCPRGWAALSALNGIQLLAKDGQSIADWFSTTSGGSYGFALTWLEQHEAKAVRDGRTGYTKKQFPLLMLLKKGALDWIASENSSSWKSIQLPIEPKNFPGIGKVFFNPNANQKYTSLCLRRQLPSANNAMKLPSDGTLTLESLASRYQISVNEFYAQVSQDPELEAYFGAFFITANKAMDPNVFTNKLQTRVENILGTYLPNWQQLEEQAVAEEKHQAYLQGEQARREQQRKWDAQIAEKQRKKEEQLAAQRREQERREAIRRENSKPLYANYAKIADRDYTDSHGRRITKASYDDLMNRYNESTYGRRYYDSEGNPVSVAEYKKLNQAPERQQQYTITVPQLQTQQIILVPQLQTQQYLIPVVPVYPSGGYIIQLR